MESKSVLLTSHGGPKGCEMSRLTHFLDNWLTDGGKVVSLMSRSHSTPLKDYITHFC
jgi:protoheme ferro-lyase